MDLRKQKSHLQIIDSPTNVDCAREVGLRRTLRSLIEWVIPYCCTYQPPPSDQNDTLSVSSSTSSSDQTGVVVTGTFFGHRRGHVSFCLQEDTRPSSPPLLLLELAVPTAALAREMEEGFLRIALRSKSNRRSNIFNVPVWSMYCNGRKVGFAVRRETTENDVGFLRLMQSVSVGAGVIPNGETLYLRAKFERVTGSSDLESFHMVNQGGGYGQELSIFLSRS
ncbi:Protein MIZU-KUSSEI 1-like plant [Arabidopsis thaliana x Arabidopsis arenosa]|uniref:Protein MIZU-KUSSEI 1-like plant n=1 Tax=Arabidopsis thaliana x Arabidopsis arenosa TaxID=1240361 RepID=A0A8T2BLK9_9BRAS|nr:Protein MIZU-KUSSEI 1-like plant [Arabidopsis thaliana x Arabidopsis arenosa]